MFDIYASGLAGAFVLPLVYLRPSCSKWSGDTEALVYRFCD